MLLIFLFFYLCSMSLGLMNSFNSELRVNSRKYIFTFFEIEDARGLILVALKETIFSD